MNKFFLLCFFVLLASSTQAGTVNKRFLQQTEGLNSFPKVDADLALYDSTVQNMKDDFAKIPADSNNKEWVIKKIQHMVDVDQYTRKYFEYIYSHQYSKEEKQYFQINFLSRMLGVDQKNADDLKSLLSLYGWFKISEFSSITDQNAWLIVQHADDDPEFQKSVLSILEILYSKGETNPANYALLYDRVAASWHNPQKRQLQRYGTQGTCVGPEQWEPLPIEDPEHLDSRRASVGLESAEDNKTRMNNICKYYQ